MVDKVRDTAGWLDSVHFATCQLQAAANTAVECIKMPTTDPMAITCVSLNEVKRASQRPRKVQGNLASIYREDDILAPFATKPDNKEHFRFSHNHITVATGTFLKNQLHCCCQQSIDLFDSLNNAILIRDAKPDLHQLSEPTASRKKRS